MANWCDNLPAGSTTDCTSPWGVNCTSQKKFEFTALWTITQNIFQACSNDSRLFRTIDRLPTLNNISLTQEYCEAVAGADWTKYSGSDIWNRYCEAVAGAHWTRQSGSDISNRLATWKFPLLQLVASFPRPPLGLNVECFVIFHLLGDPVDSLWHLLLKLKDCERRAKFWRAQFDGPLHRFAEDLPQQVWKSLTLITDAYDEWDQGDDAIAILQTGL